MTIDDIDIDEEQPAEENPNEGVNNLLHIIHDKKRIGSGFIIRNDGLFISVGHNFRELNPQHPEIGIDDYTALFAGKGYSIVPLLMEYGDYKNTDNDPGEMYEDLFIGRLEGFDQQETLKPFLPLAEEQPSGTVNVEGYKSAVCRAPKAFHTDYGCAIYLNLQVEVSERAIVPEFQRCKNLLFIPEMDAKCHGLSGGPVYADGKIYGTLQGRMFITSPYILARLRELGIVQNL